MGEDNLKIRRASVVKRIFIIILVLAVAILVMVGLHFHFHWKSKIEEIILPEGTETIKTKVSLSDIYGPHMLAVKIIGTDMSYDEIVTFVEANNDSPVSIFVVCKDGEHYSIEWDDWALDPDYIKGREEDGMNYYLISLNLSSNIRYLFPKRLRNLGYICR